MSRYPVPWISMHFLAALVLIAGSFLMVWFLDGVSYDYNRHDPDFELLERIARSDTPERGDFSGLNGGDWTVLCLFGSKAAIAAGLEAGEISQASAAAVLEEHEAADFVLDESEFTLAYVTGSGSAKVLRHPHGFAFARNGAAKCTRRDSPVLPLPLRGE